MKRMKDVFVGLVVGLLIAGAMVYFNPRPAPEIITKVIEVPVTQNPDLTINSTGKLTGYAKVTPIPAVKGGPADQTEQPETRIKNEGILALVVGSEIVTELTGEIKTEYVNSAGKIVGNGVHPVQMELITTVQADGLSYQVFLDDSISIKVDTTPPDPPRFTGRLFYDGSFDLEYRLNKLWIIEPFVMVRYDRDDNQTSITGGIEFTF
jgi:hypothetical protein